MNNNKSFYLKKNLVLFILSSSLYLLNNIVIKSLTENIHYLHYYMKNYFNDTLVGIFGPAIVNLTLILLFNKDKLKKHQILLYLFLFGLFWEYGISYFIRSAIADPYDILAYVFGGIIYIVITGVIDLCYIKVKEKESVFKIKNKQTDDI